ncbi:hypothetical protein CRG98_038215 [Punica granatum]|uniref:Uncharacterized protein n=1 Tax=Punica granatum TaxID=22663 RepID=A0A2I0IBL5_PUNGR|nr:hypothetical protein CRG98_038215 [Punica granatum]
MSMSKRKRVGEGDGSRPDDQPRCEALLIKMSFRLMLRVEEKRRLNMRRAYDNWDHAAEFTSSSYSVQNSGISPAGALRGRQDYFDPSDSHLTGFHTRAPPGLSNGISEIVVGGDNETAIGKSLINPQDGDLGVAIQNQPMHSLNQPEVPVLHQNSALTEPNSALPTFQGYCHVTEARMLDNGTDSWIVSPSGDITNRNPPHRGVHYPDSDNWFATELFSYLHLYFGIHQYLRAGLNCNLLIYLGSKKLRSSAIEQSLFTVLVVHFSTLR